MRRTLVLVVGVVVMMLGSAAPAAADRPAVFTFPAVFTDFDPCTGDLHELTVLNEVSLHVHSNNMVQHWRREGSTDSGYTLVNGGYTQTQTSGAFHITFTDIWQADDGRKFRASGQIIFNENTGELKVFKFPPDTLRCLGGETILP